jgi:hypothetical protein
VRVPVKPLQSGPIILADSGLNPGGWGSARFYRKYPDDRSDRYLKTGLPAKPTGSSSHQIAQTAHKETIAQPKVLANIGFWSDSSIKSSKLANNIRDRCLDTTLSIFIDRLSRIIPRDVTL